MCQTGANKVKENSATEMLCSAANASGAGLERNKGFVRVAAAVSACAARRGTARAYDRGGFAHVR
jgi:hypothetical protein